MNKKDLQKRKRERTTDISNLPKEEMNNTNIRQKYAKNFNENQKRSFFHL